MIDFTVKPDNGDEFEVKAGTRDIYMWEKGGKGRSMSTLMREVSVTDMYAIAHIAARRQQLFNGTLDEFTQTCELSFEEDDGPGPTQQGP